MLLRNQMYIIYPRYLASAKNWPAWINLDNTVVVYYFLVLMGVFLADAAIAIAKTQEDGAEYGEHNAMCNGGGKGIDHTHENLDRRSEQDTTNQQ